MTVTEEAPRGVSLRGVLFSLVLKYLGEREGLAPRSGPFG